MLNLYYTLNYDGEGTPAFVVIGNPIVLSSDDYIIYSDGLYKWFSYSTKERWTGKFWTDGKPIYQINYTQSTFTSGNTEVLNLGMETNISNGGYFTYYSPEFNHLVSFPYILSGSDAIRFVVRTDNGKLVLSVTGTDLPNNARNLNTWIEYTKIADSAGYIPPFSN